MFNRGQSQLKSPHYLDYFPGATAGQAAQVGVNTAQAGATSASQTGAGGGITGQIAGGGNVNQAAQEAVEDQQKSDQQGGASLFCFLFLFLPL